MYRRFNWKLNIEQINSYVIIISDFLEIFCYKIYYLIRCWYRKKLNINLFLKSTSDDEDLAMSGILWKLVLGLLVESIGLLSKVRCLGFFFCYFKFILVYL